MPVWRHTKRNTTYTEVGRARMNASDPTVAHLDGKTAVVYRSVQTGELEVRMAYEFDDGRFVRESE